MKLQSTEVVVVHQIAVDARHVPVDPAALPQRLAAPAPNETATAEAQA